MKYSIDKKDQYTVFSILEENLNSTKAPDLKSELVILHNEGIQNLIMDISAIKYVDSSGLSAILTAHRLWEDNGTFILTGVLSGSVKTLITISRLDSILTIIPTLTESIEYAMMEQLQRELNKDKA